MLSDVDLGAVDSTKYDALVQWAQAEFQVRGVAFKAIRQGKNALNRIREVTGRPLDLVVILADAADGWRPNSVANLLTDCLGPRANVKAGIIRIASEPPIYTLVGGDPALVARANAIFPNLLLIAPRPKVSHPAADLSHISFPFTVGLGDFRSLLAARLGVQESAIAVKQVTATKNARNRLSEAFGLDPGVVVLVAKGLPAKKLADTVRLRVVSGPSVLVAEQSADGWEITAVPKSIPLDTAEDHLALSSESNFLINSHVTRLKRHLPLGANSRELYEEQRDADDFGSISTRAYDFVKTLLDDPNTRVIVLTGDAGHGKTHLCRRILIECCGLSPDDALAALRSDIRGERAFARASGRAIKIVKDLSEIEPPMAAAEVLSAVSQDEDCVAVVCANEGRLRSILELAPTRLDGIRRSLDASVRLGRTSAELGIEVVNLNHQSVTSGEFFDKLLQRWIHDGRSWQVCKGCAAATKCPILANRRFLAKDGELRGKPAQRFTDLVRIVEQTGYVLTIRETLMLVAYAIVGRRDCSRVHTDAREARAAEGRPDIVELLFSASLAPHELERLRVIERIRRMDPGAVAMREVDDELLRVIDTRVSVSDELASGPSRSRRTQREGQRKVRDDIRAARREAYFTGNDSAVPHWRRLGFLWYGDFEAIGTKQNLPLRIRNQAVHGLHVFQGIRPKSESEFYLVDPAFSSGGSSTSVIAARIQLRNIEVRAESQAWPVASFGRLVSDSVDWLDRRVVLIFERSEHVLPLDVRQFEVLMRASTGLTFRSFNGPDVRRILSRLALVIQSRGDGDSERIVVMDGHVPRQLSIDVDNSFSVGEM
jgi:hypothetical protein